MINSSKHTSGFTLIELLVVIVIIGILATISVSTFQGYFEKARLAKAQQSYSQIKSLFLAQNASTEENLFSLWYPFDGPYLNTTTPFILDKSGNNNNMSHKTGDIFFKSDDTGIGVGNSLYTNKTKFTGSHDTDTWPTNKFTLAFWVKLAEKPSGNYVYPFSGSGFWVRLYKNGQAGFDIGHGNVSKSPELLKINKWSYIVFSYNGSDMRVFVDGEMVSIKRNATEHNDFIYTLFIGQDATAPFNGWLDEVMFFPYAFDGKELK